MSFVDALCPACSLCCNGVLFADVQLKRADDLAQLRKLGVSWLVQRGKRSLPQPCACLDGTLCRIYNNRPSRCRTFDCRLIQRAQAGELRLEKALESIRAARRAVSAVMCLIRALGDNEETAPLSHRYSRLMAQPIDLGGNQAAIRRRSRLMLAVDRLARALERDFLT